MITYAEHELQACRKLDKMARRYAQAREAHEDDIDAAYDSLWGVGDTIGFTLLQPMADFMKKHIDETGEGTFLHRLYPRHGFAYYAALRWSDDWLFVTVLPPKTGAPYEIRVSICDDEAHKDRLLENFRAFAETPEEITEYPPCD